MKRTSRLLLSAGTGLMAAALAWGYGSLIRAEAEQAQREVLAAYGGDLVVACVASRDIEPGEVLDEANVQEEEWVASLLPKDAATSLEEVVGERATSSIPARAVLNPVYFKQDDRAIEVPEGMVAVSVPSDDERSVGGAVTPGDQVDVYVSNAGVADLLCRAQVIDTSARAEEADGASIAWVTLAVEPERVAEVLAATAQGTISLVLPGALDEGEKPTGDEAAADAEEAASAGETAGGPDGADASPDESGAPADAAAAVEGAAATEQAG